MRGKQASNKQKRKAGHVKQGHPVGLGSAEQAAVGQRQGKTRGLV